MTREEELVELLEQNTTPDGKIDLYPVFVELFGKERADEAKEIILNSNPNPDEQKMKMFHDHILSDIKKRGDYR